jgi:zinc D-Ala-D-Ala carboxypeptidase
MVSHGLALGAGLLVALAMGYLYWHTKTTLEAKLQEAHQAQESLSAEKAELEAARTLQDEAIANLTRDRDELADELNDTEEELEDFEDQVGDAIETVGVLDKLSKIDPELLQKYSKVYFLNEHYAPPRITQIDKKYVYDETRAQYLHAQAMPFFKDMVEAALKDGVNLYVVSAYRSYGQQSALKAAYQVTYGSGANAFSADQGYSEHQLGTTIDFTTTGINGGLDGFENTPAYQWLQNNAYRFGFVLSYPENNAYYVYEPWHWRFVGEDLASDLHDDGKSFYNVDQREIDKYLVSIFD